MKLKLGDKHFGSSSENALNKKNSREDDYVDALGTFIKNVCLLFLELILVLAICGIVAYFFGLIEF